MITLRYHIVSLVAVFLALAVGIIAGSTVVDQRLIDGLELQREVDQRIKANLRDENDTLRTEVSLWETFGDDLLIPSLAKRLDGVVATLVIPPFTPDDTRVAIREGILAAGAEIDGEIRLSPRFVLKDDTATEQLSLAVDAPDLGGDELLRRAGRAIGATLDGNALGAWTSGPLVAADFVEIAERKKGIPETSDHVVVLCWDATRENADLAEPLLGSILAGGLDADAAIAIAEVIAQEPSLATYVRDSDGLRTSIPTVDHATTSIGAVALASALAALVSTGSVHHYGVLPGAEAALPEDVRVQPSLSPKPKPKPTATPKASPSRRSTPAGSPG